MRKRLFCWAAAIVVCGAMALPTDAADGKWMVRIRAIDVAPDAKGDEGLTTADVDSDFTIEADFTRFFSKNLALELIAATASQEVTVETDSGTLSLGSVNHLPPTATLQWHFLPDGKFQPYVGAGLNMTIFYNQSGLLKDLDLDTSFGLAAQVGADWMITDRVAFNVDLKYISISTDVKSEGEKIGTLDINPWVFGVGIGCKF